MNQLGGVPWQWRGTIGRLNFLFWAVLLAACKLAADRLLLRAYGGDAPWDLMMYLRPGLFQDLAVSPAVATALVLEAVLFAWLGLALTVRRLRAAGLHPALAAIFFIPYMKFLLFVVLVLLPAAKQPLPPARPDRLARFIPRSKKGSGAVAMALTAGAGACALVLGTLGFRDYGWSLFFGLPFVLGMMTALLYGYHEPRRLRETMGLSMKVLGLLTLFLLLFALEGLICILMAAPILIAMTLTGSWVGWLVQRAYWEARTAGTGRVLCLAVLMLPGAMGLEHLAPARPPVRPVCTAIEIAAPPAAVWKNVVTFRDLPRPKEWVFKTGVAYPTHAEIDGCGTGAIRRCCFTTGTFVEPITVWDEPRLLRFAVTSNPPPMQELNPFGTPEPPHLHGYMESEQGQFLLTDLGNGRTRLEGTTWYRHGLWPDTYWRLWSDHIIHAIHTRVLTHIKQLAERQAAPDEAARTR